MDKKVEIVNTRNRILSKNIYFSLDSENITHMNNNILVIGGSGCGKSFKFAKPNIMQLASSFIITDPKGELCRDTAGFLEHHGYDVKVLNLLDMKKSSRYNPFDYVQSDVDVIKLIQNLIRNTTPKGASPGDPFWEKAEGMLLQSLFYYVWKEGVKNEDTGKIEHNIGAVLKLLTLAEFTEDRNGNKQPSELDHLMDELAKKNPKHPAVLNYNKVMRGAADTVRSIIISVNARLAPIQNDEIVEFMSEDEMDIRSIGARKTVIFCVIPDVDKTYNFLVGLFYTQAFQQLYYAADFIYDGKLPVNVTFLLDEFANVALPDDFTSLLSTMRSRQISAIIIVQNMAQLKKLFEKDYETIQGNCDVMIFLGGNERGTHKEIEEAIGKQTIYKKSYGVTRGKNGSSSSNEDTLGRELMMASEVRKLRRDECIILINGYDAIRDKKIETWNHPLFPELKKYGGYQYDARLKRAIKKKNQKNDTGIEFVSKDQLALLQSHDKILMDEYNTQVKIADISGEVRPEKPELAVINLTFEQLLQLDIDDDTGELNLDEIISQSQMEQNERKCLDKIAEDEAEMHENHIDVKAELNNKEEAFLIAKLGKEGFSVPQQRLLLGLFRKGSGMDEDTIMYYFSPDMSIEDMQDYIDVMSA